ncbi:hypothetical protein HK105_207727 [Polyrhizophydium stewartii]|uniref:Xylanolytic transcriptional activator regulatory domain-containing protein n=1 Tax=Polyrhizophydium stewartii TaxID=2732419 RepID=A0ABR4MZM6_9FUNG
MDLGHGAARATADAQALPDAHALPHADGDTDMDDDDERKRSRISLACDNCNRKECSYERRLRKKALTVEYIDHLEDRLRAIESMLHTPAQPQTQPQRTQQHAVKIEDCDPALAAAHASLASTHAPGRPSAEASLAFHAQVHAVSTSASDLSPSAAESVATSSPRAALLDPLAALSASASASSVVPASVRHHQAESVINASPASGGLGGSPVIPTLQTLQTSSLQSTRPAMFTNIIREDLFKLFFQYVFPTLYCLQLPDSQAYWRMKAQGSTFLSTAMYCSALKFTSFLDPRYQRHTAGDIFFFEARTLLDTELDCPTQATVLGLILLYQYSYGSGRRSAGRTYFTICQRLCAELRLGREPDPNAPGGLPPPYEQEINRRLFWLCWALENYSCILAFRQHTLDPIECLVTLPRTCHMGLTANEPPTLDSLLSIKVMSSPDLYIPPLRTTTPEGYLLILEKTLANIVSLSPALGRSRTSISEVDQAYEQLVLEASLKAWQDSLPDWISLAETHPSVLEATSSNPGTWLLMYIKVMFHFATTMLFRPSVLAALKTPALTETPAFSKGRKAALLCSSIISQIMTFNPEFRCISYFMCYIVYQIGWMHAALARIAKSPDEAREFTSLVEMHMNALRNLGKYWAMPAHQYSMLRIFKNTSDVNILLLPALTVRSFNATAHCPPEQLQGFFVVQPQQGRSPTSVSTISQADLAPHHDAPPPQLNLRSRQAVQDNMPADPFDPSSTQTRMAHKRPRDSADADISAPPRPPRPPQPQQQALAAHPGMLQSTFNTVNPQAMPAGGVPPAVIASSADLQASLAQITSLINLETDLTFTSLEDLAFPE